MSRAQARARRERAAKVRRNRVILAGSALLSVLMLGLWFPASALYHQHQAIAATTTQLTQLRQQDRALAEEQRLLKSPAEVERLAREQYQLVSPGQRAYQILPPSASGKGDAAYAGDPGLQPLVSPSAAAELPPGTLGPGSAGAAAQPSGVTLGEAAGPGSHSSAGQRAQGQAATPGGAPHGSAHPGGPDFFGRIVRTLEFWR